VRQENLQRELSGIQKIRRVAKKKRQARAILTRDDTERVSGGQETLEE